ncbi:hypothetical protein [Azospirillum rugosum]|uniref:Chain length determinant protein n=1 Tax=Azospirillum rugosum TaxID=416170 RepID=A0ABS4SVY3_9PROT|nr:hypothetical protein [Azospirillum rugosum]MBP2296721.1 hypothetical protein [Azospirillum rugosum]MDQ0530466.1 hypothetical protein [Azospirillum rugosum]
MPDGSSSLRLGNADAGALAGRQLRGFVRTLREGWRVPLAGAVLGLLLGAGAVRVVTPQYTAGMVVGPTARVGAAAMGARLPVLLGHDTPLAAAEPGPGDELLSDFGRYLELFGSVPVAERMMADAGLMRALFPDRWDAEAGAWRPPAGVLPWLKRLFLAAVGREDWLEPDPERVSSALKDRILVEMVRSGPMRRITLRHPDREVALRLLTAVAVATDAHLRAEAARRSAAQIAHVRARLAGITVAEHRRALADLLSEQERVAMMIEVDLPLAADAIVPPTAARRPDWPNPVLVVPVAALVGLVAGAVFLSLRTVWRAGS